MTRLLLGLPEIVVAAAVVAVQRMTAVGSIVVAGAVERPAAEGPTWSEKHNR